MCSDLAICHIHCVCMHVQSYNRGSRSKTPPWWASLYQQIRCRLSIALEFRLKSKVKHFISLKWNKPVIVQSPTWILKWSQKPIFFVKYHKSGLTVTVISHEYTLKALLLSMMLKVRIKVNIFHTFPLGLKTNFSWQLMSAMLYSFVKFHVWLRNSLQCIKEKFSQVQVSLQLWVFIEFFTTLKCYTL